MRRRRKPVWDPVKDWDGMCVRRTGTHSPEAIQAHAQSNMRSIDPRLAADNAEAKATPIGGMQFHYKPQPKYQWAQEAGEFGLAYVLNIGGKP